MVAYFVPIGLMSAAPPPSLVFGSAGSTMEIGSGTHTHTGLSFRTAGPTRTLIVFAGLGNGTGGFVNSLSIGGVPATLVSSVNVGTGTSSQIWVASVPSGTSGSVSLSGPSGNWNSMVCVYAAYDLASNTPTDTSTDISFPVSTSVSVQANGIVIAGMTVFASNPGSASWSGITQDFAANYSGDGLSGASRVATSATTVNASGTYSIGGTGCGCTASFR
jgi:hypothetical protein